MFKRLKAVLADGDGEAVDRIAVGVRLLDDGNTSVTVEHPGSPLQAGTGRVTLFIKTLEIEAESVRAGSKGNHGIRKHAQGAGSRAAPFPLLAFFGPLAIQRIHAIPRVLGLVGPEARINRSRPFDLQTVTSSFFFHFRCPLQTTNTLLHQCWKTKLNPLLRFIAHDDPSLPQRIAHGTTHPCQHRVRRAITERSPFLAPDAKRAVRLFPEQPKQVHCFLRLQFCETAEQCAEEGSGVRVGTAVVGCVRPVSGQKISQTAGFTLLHGGTQRTQVTDQAGQARKRRFITGQVQGAESHGRADAAAQGMGLRRSVRSAHSGVGRRELVFDVGPADRRQKYPLVHRLHAGQHPVQIKLQWLRQAQVIQQPGRCCWALAGHTQAVTHQCIHRTVGHPALHEPHLVHARLGQPGGGVLGGKHHRLVT